MSKVIDPFITILIKLILCKGKVPSLFKSMSYPTNYIQEPGILKISGAQIKKIGKQPLIISGRKAWEKAGKLIDESFVQEGLNYDLEMFAGHCSEEEFNRLLESIKDEFDVLIGVGGGQCMDMCKLIANHLAIPVVTIPTLASTCAASSALSIIYTPEHEFVRMVTFEECPIFTLVDTNIILDAPVRYLTSGIADTLVKWYEATPINEGKYKNARTRAGLKIAELIKEILFESSEGAISEIINKKSGQALQEVIDCNIFLGGLVGGIGSETCHGSGAHAIHYGLTIIPEFRKAYHGELVGYGLLCQLYLEGKVNEEFYQLMKLYKSIDLPLSLFDLGWKEVRNADLQRAAKIIFDEQDSIHLLPVPLTEEKIYESLIETHNLAESFKNDSLTIR